MNHIVSTDPLMQCLVILTRLNNKPITAEALAHGLPFDPKDKNQRLFSLDKPKSNFSRAAARAGLVSQLMKRQLRDIPSLVLPAILILKDDKACVLKQISYAEGTAEIVVPSLDETPIRIDIEKLSEQYLGFVFFLTQKYEALKHTKQDNQTLGNKNWFFGTLFNFKGIYARVLLATFIVNLFVVVGPLFTMNVYDRVIPHNAIETLWVLTAGVAIVYLFDLLLKIIRTMLLESAAKKSDIILSSLLFEQAMNLKLLSKPRSIGAFANNFKEFDHIRSFFASSAITAFIELPFAIIFLLVIYSISPTLALVPLFVSLLILCFSIPMSMVTYKIIESTHEAAGCRSGILVEALANLETIKAFNASSGMQWLWEESTGDIASKSLRSRILSNALTTLSAFLAQSSSVVIIVMGVYLVRDGELSMGGLIAISMLSSRAIAPMSQVISLLSGFEQMKAGLKTLNNLMSLDVERPEKKQFIRRPEFKGMIEFNGVSFCYPGDNNKALDNISFKIMPGERVGIIGPVGSGKSTIGNILMGFYEPFEGAVFIDGLDIKQIDPVDLRHNFNYVPQDVALFSGTIRDNITLKSPNVTDQVIITAAEIGIVNNFTDRHPMGMDLQVGERGLNLSGGQRQSVAVARGFLEKAPIALLDEPTNSMDFTTELQVVGNLMKRTHGKTTMIITHKPTILELVTRIIVMDSGKIVMDGPKDEILTRLRGNTA